MDDLAVVISNYNEKKFTEDCLNNLAEISSKEIPDLKVIVKDQGSTDGSRELIETNFPWAHLIKGGNDGLSKAYNLGYRRADAKYVLFLGMDAFPEEGTLTGILEYLDKNQEVGAATCKLVLRDGSLDMDAHRAFPTPWVSLTRLTGLGSLFPNSKNFNKYFLPRENMEKPHEIDLCISHFMITRKKVLDQIGGFDEDFFLYGEDVDICYRIKQAGWKIMYLPQWKCLHWKGGSVGIRKSTRNIVKKPLKHRIRMQSLSTEAMKLFVKKHYSEKYPKPLIHLMLFASNILGKIRVVIETFRK
ncbi:glycosyltransferase family 2 protein [Patescibacteria group bacterium]|nr:glycosyltransferase family 2 protein [Patescibacteria group bacterium]